MILRTHTVDTYLPCSTLQDCVGLVISMYIGVNPLLSVPSDPGDRWRYA